MKNKFFSLTAISLMILGIMTLGLSAHKEVHLILNGEKETKSTFAMTVGGFLRQEGLSISEEDSLSPSQQHILWNNDVINLKKGIHTTLTADQETLQFTTLKRKPANILAEREVPLYPLDQVLVNGEVVDPHVDLPYQSQHTIRVIRATPLRVHIDNQEIRHITTHAQTLARALWEEDIVLYEGDDLNPPPTTLLTGEPLQVRLKRAKPVKITTPTRTINARTTADIVGAALSEAGLTLQGRDYSTPAENEPLPETGKIDITRVEEEVILEQEPISFSNTYQPVNDLELDKRTILEGGEYGLRTKRVRVVYENGEETARVTEKEWTAKEPQPRVIGYGTKVVVRTAETADGTIRYWRKITAYATSYNENCPGCGNITASGTRLKKGAVAVTIEWYRYMKGLKVYIPGYGYGAIEDVGAGIEGKYWVDLGYRSENYVPWHENVSVYFLGDPPPPEDIMYVLY